MIPSGTTPGDREHRLAEGLRVTAVVPTHDRAKMLDECLSALAAQTFPVARTVVVDNASNDDTADTLATRGSLDVVRLGQNTGGAGGFAAGIDAAMRETTDALWLLDDDTVPEPDALAALVRAFTTYRGRCPDLVASRVVWTDGRDHPMNTPRVRPGVSDRDLDLAAEVGCRPIRSASFVSVLVSAGSVHRHGLPIAAYFLWNDDFEYTARLVRRGVGLYCPASVVVHKTRLFGERGADPGERFYLEVRNKSWLFARSRSLSTVEKLLYGGSTAGTWVSIIAKSPHRRQLARHLVRGLADSQRRPPGTETILRGAGHTIGTGHIGHNP